jgi:hypothetical protein
VVDLNNSGWSSYNGSDVYVTNYTGWQNSTDCYGVTRSCTNYTGPLNETIVNGMQSTWWLVGGLNSSWSVDFWTNSSGMNSSHRFSLVVTIWGVADASAADYGLVAPWSASASAELNMAGPGHRATLNSVTIH